MSCVKMTLMPSTTAHPRLRLSRPEHRLHYFQQKLERPLPEAQRDRLLKRVAAAEKALTATVQLTARDLDILQAIARFRFMSSRQVIQYLTGLSAHELSDLLRETPWAHQQILRRLALLFDRRILVRPPQQDLQLSAFGPLIYGIARDGARELLARGCNVDAELDWQLKNARASALFLQHTLATTEAMLSFDRACRKLSAVQLVDHHDMTSYFPAPALRDDPYKLRVSIEHHQAQLTIAVVPDRLFAIHYPDNSRNVYALELDRGTMDVTAKRLTGKASYLRKLAGYYAAFRQNKFVERWGTKSLRILTVTTSDKRIASMLQAQHSITRGRANDLFLYTTLDRLAAHGPGGSAWIRADGTTTSILKA